MPQAQTLTREFKGASENEILQEACLWTEGNPGIWVQVIYFEVVGGNLVGVVLYNEYNRLAKN